ncbi:MAG: sulfatase [Pirellulales bacterium]
MKLCTLLVAALSFGICCEILAAAPPNIIVLVTDDHRADSLGCAGTPILHTPNLDEFARQGVRFENAFVTTSICAMSRATMMLGQYQSRHGIDDFQTSLSPAQRDASYFGRLKQEGYYLGFIGKWGVAEPSRELFDFDRGFPGQGRFFDPKHPERPHLTIRMGNQAFKFLDECPADRPFCLSISFKAAHIQDGDKETPYPFEPDLADLYADEEIPRYPLSESEFIAKQPPFLQSNEARVRWAISFDTDEKYQRNVKGHYRQISGVDRVVGRIRRKLAELGHDKNTVILFTSDNGYFLGDRGWAGKWFAHEASIRVPLIIYDPRMPRDQAGKVREEFALNIDLAPTVLDFAGLEPSEGMQGVSLKPIVEGQTPSDWRTEFYYEHTYQPETIPSSEAVRTERYKYIRYLGRDFEEFYDLETDPIEANNLIDDPKSQQLVAELKDRLTELREAAK